MAWQPIDPVQGAIDLLRKALRDQGRAERDASSIYGHNDLALHSMSERWDFVRGALALLELTQAGYVVQPKPRGEQ